MTNVVFLITNWSIFRQAQLIIGLIALFSGQFFAQNDKKVSGITYAIDKKQAEKYAR